jgi:tryptophan synthase alpha chain
MTIAEKFAELRSRGEKGLVLFFTAGDQPLDELPAIVETLIEGGADLLEVGIPFSDPFGEGPTIQESSQRSLDRGTTPRGVLEALAKASKLVPVLTMGYYNPVLAFGPAKYALALREAGACGAIIQDLVPDEADGWCAAAEAAGIDTVFLAAPTSTEQRIADVAQRSTGFVYAVSRTGVTGVTGAGQEVPPEVAGLVSRIRQKTEKPVCVGFGVSKPEHVKMVCSVADGAVVGSWLVDFLHENWDGGRGAAAVKDAVAKLKQATRTL